MSKTRVHHSDLKALARVAELFIEANNELSDSDAFVDSIVVNTIDGDLLAKFGWDENGEIVAFFKEEENPNE
jgi:hypothetical protein